MKTKIFVLVFVLLVSNLLVGCVSLATPIDVRVDGSDAETQMATITHPPADQPSLTPTVIADIKADPSPTPEPEPTEVPSPTPTATQQPQLSSLGRIPIDASTLDDLELLETIGKGSIRRLEYQPDVGVFTLVTALGVHLYDESLNPIAFYENVIDIYQVPGKAQMVAATPEQTLALIDLQTGGTIQTMVPKGANHIGRITFSQDGKVMGVIVVQDHEVRLNWEQYRIDIWDLEGNAQVAKLLSDLFGACYDLAFSDDHTQLIASCVPSGGGILKLVMWNIPEQEVAWYLSGEGDFLDYPFSKDGSLFTTYVVFDPVTDSSQITIHRSLNGAEVGRVGGKLSDNAFSHDSQHIVTTSSGQVIAWHTADSQRVKAFDTGLDSPSASYSEDGAYILVNGGEQAWDADSFELVEDYVRDDHISPEVSIAQWHQLGYLSGIRGVEVLEDDRLFVWGTVEFYGEDWWSSDVHLWWWFPDTDVYEEVFISATKSQPVLSPDKNRFAVCTEEGIKLITRDQKSVEFGGHCKSYQHTLAFSKDGEQLFINSGTLVDVISLESGEVLQQLRAQDVQVGTIQTINEGDYLITSSAGKISGGCETILWELNPLNFVRKWTIPGFMCLQYAAIDHAKQNLVTINEKVSVWRISDGWYLNYFDGTAVAFSEDGGLLAVGTRESSINFYETDRWTLIETVGILEEEQPIIEGNFFGYVRGSSVAFLQFANQGKLLISVTNGNVIQLWGVP